MRRQIGTHHAQRGGRGLNHIRHCSEGAPDKLCRRIAISQIEALHAYHGRKNPKVR